MSTTNTVFSYEKCDKIYKNEWQTFRHYNILRIEEFPAHVKSYAMEVDEDSQLIHSYAQN